MHKQWYHLSPLAEELLVTGRYHYDTTIFFAAQARRQDFSPILSSKNIKVTFIFISLIQSNL